MQSLHLSPDADTPSVAIAGTVLLTYAAIIGHIILLLAFLIIAFLKEKEITVGQAGLLLNFKKAKSVNIFLQLLAYLLTAYWFWNFIETTQVKFF